MNEYYDEAKDGWVIVKLAPTGLAAYNINGQTLHRFLKFHIFKNNNEKYWPLSDSTLKIIRQ
jgi:hypothetical protein